MIIEFGKLTKWSEIKDVLSKLEKDYSIILYCASTWQTTVNKENYTAFDCTRKNPPESEKNEN